MRAWTGTCLMNHPMGLLRSLWRPLDPHLLAAGWTGEHLVARVRLRLLLALASIPICQLLFGDNSEAWVGLAAAALALGPALLVLLAVRRGIGHRWLGFASSLLDVTIITGELLFFAFLGHYHLVVNSRVVYPLYFIAIAATALRYDARICVVTGAAAMAEYLGVLLWTIDRGFADAAPNDASRYGTFEWNDQFARLVLLATATAIATATVVRARELLHLSMRDRLTGLFNRTALEQRLREELYRRQRHGGQLAFALLDLDDFKAFNDAYGHLAGDEVLKKVADELQRSVRLADVVARWGGEELALILPDLSQEHAEQRLDHLRRRLAIAPVLVGESGPLSVTASIGLALAPIDGDTVEELVERADERLYVAKRAGKNTVVGRDPAAPAA